MKLALVNCILIVVIGLMGLDESGGIYNYMPMPGWIYWPITIFGLIGCIWCVKYLIEAQNAPLELPPPLDEQCAQAKADLDRMYLREHGTMPEWPEREAGKEEEKKDAM